MCIRDSIRALAAVSVSCFTTPHSLNRLPSMSIPTSGAVVGRIRPVSYTHLDVYKRQNQACRNEYSCFVYVYTKSAVKYLSYRSF